MIEPEENPDPAKGDLALAFVRELSDCSLRLSSRVRATQEITDIAFRECLNFTLKFAVKRQSDLADYLGVNTSTLARWMNGKAPSSPSARRAKARAMSDLIESYAEGRLMKFGLPLPGDSVDVDRLHSLGPPVNNSTSEL